MKTSPPALAVALTVSLLSAGSVPAAALSAPAPTVRSAPTTAADISAGECVRGGGMIIISSNADGTNSFTKRCQGGVHDGQTIE
ncbi:hypothetical protein [Streptomyces sp. NPDC057877]|uniref:hypothetical protein n=1 Tax=Streptomyces sp. NPDC057877 TaxID=3346269 RepID=UPI0036C91027